MAKLGAKLFAVCACSAATLVCCVLLAGSARADSIQDPIIDTEPGCCSIDFTGQIAFFIDISDNTNNCISDPESGITTCGLTSFIKQARLGSSTGQLVSMVLKNVTSDSIFNLDFRFGFPEAPFSAPPNAIFANVMPVSNFEAVYGLGPGKSPVCSSTNPGNCIGNCPVLESSLQQSSDCLPSDVAIGLETLKIPTAAGFVEMDVTANVPEPSSLALIVSALPVVWITRRKLRRA